MTTKHYAGVTPGRPLPRGVTASTGLCPRCRAQLVRVDGEPGRWACPEHGPVGPKERP